MAARSASGANRIVVQDGLCDALTKRLAETPGAMKVAEPDLD